MVERALCLLVLACVACGDNRGVPVDVDATPSPLDAGVPDAEAPPTLEEMCGAIPVTVDDWERCYRKRYCEAMVNCSEQNRYLDAEECIERSDAVSGGALAHDLFERQRAVADGRAAIDTAAFTQCLT